MSRRKFLFSPLGRVILVALGLALYAAVFIYPLNSLSSKLSYPILGNIFDTEFTPTDLLFIFLFLFPLAGRFFYQMTHSIWSRHLMAIAMTWSGFGFFIFFPTLLLDIASGILPLDERVITHLSFGLIAICSSLAIYGIVNANFLFVNRLEFKDPRLSRVSTAIQLSDVHIGSRSSFYIRKLVRNVNSLKAEKVFITGDLVDLSCVEKSELSLLKEIEAPVYFVTGNHDRYVSLDRLLPILKQQDFHILRNETLVLDEFNLTGIDDAEHPKQVERVLETIDIDDSRYNVLLYHRPQGFDFAAKKGINLMLAGHTHNGQIVPFNFMVKQVFNDIKGTIARHGAFLHVSTGTSTWGPIMRIGSNNEITFIQFSPEN